MGPGLNSPQALQATLHLLHHDKKLAPGAQDSGTATTITEVDSFAARLTSILNSNITATNA